MNKLNLKNLVKEIIKKATILKNKHTSEKHVPVNYACIFSQNDNEFDALIKSAKQIGSIIKET